MNIPPGTHREKERDDDDERYTEWVAEGAPKMSPSSGKRFLDLRAQQNRKRRGLGARPERQITTHQHAKYSPTRDDLGSDIIIVIIVALRAPLLMPPRLCSIVPCNYALIVSLSSRYASAAEEKREESRE